MVSKHLRNAQIWRHLVERHAMFGVAAEDLGRLVHQRRRRHGHLEATVHVVHHLGVAVAASTSALQLLLGLLAVVSVRL
jgi:hypothetical protein